MSKHSPRTPNFALSEDYSFAQGVKHYDVKTLPSGSFVRPVNFEYVPNFVLEDPRWRWFNKDIEVFCYTRFGFLAIPKASLREI